MAKQDKFEREMKIVMMVAAGSALSYKKLNPNAMDEEVLRHALRNLHSEPYLKVGGVAAASKALKYQEKNPYAGEKEIMQHVMNSTDEILSNMRQIE